MNRILSSIVAATLGSLADSAKTRAEARRDAATAPRARLDDAATRG